MQQIKLEMCYQQYMYVRHHQNLSAEKQFGWHHTKLYEGNRCCLPHILKTIFGGAKYIVLIIAPRYFVTERVTICLHSTDFTTSKIQFRDEISDTKNNRCLHCSEEVSRPDHPHSAAAMKLSLRAFAAHVEG